MFNPAGARGDQWAKYNRTYHRPESGFVENWQNTLGLTVDKYLPFSSMQDANSDYSGFFGVNRVQQRTEYLRSLADDGTIPQNVFDSFSSRIVRRGKRTRWNDMAMWANENLKDDIDHIMTDEEYFETTKEIIADRTEYVE